jgi:hypothetical protein
MITTVFLALGLMALAGSALNRLLPDLDIDLTRRACGQLVLNVFLPALNFEVVYQLPIDSTFWQVPLVLSAAAFSCAALAALVLSLARVDLRVKGSLVLASAFGNVTYLGIPVLRALFPDDRLRAMQVAILAEVTVTSLDLITSSLIAPFYGSEAKFSVKATAKEVARFPLLWAIALAATCRLSGIPMPAFVMMAMHLLGETVSGLMMLVLGMALKPSVMISSVRKSGRLITPLIIKLGLSPLVAFLIARTLKLPALVTQAITIEAAMPPQLFMLIAADKTELDTEYLAVAVLALTALSFVTLPMVANRF